ncbi:MAG: hypothetical protein Q7S37_03335 [bacterium]|nr:hypothetical protein [bacterium]
MSGKEKWYLCVSLMPGDKKPKVEILSSNYVPAEGGEIKIFGQFDSEDDAKEVRKGLGDRQLLNDWKSGLIKNYSRLLEMDCNGYCGLYPEPPRGELGTDGRYYEDDGA